MIPSRTLTCTEDMKREMENDAYLEEKALRDAARVAASTSLHDQLLQQSLIEAKDAIEEAEKASLSQVDSLKSLNDVLGEVSSKIQEVVDSVKEISSQVDDFAQDFKAKLAELSNLALKLSKKLKV